VQSVWYGECQSCSLEMHIGSHSPATHSRKELRVQDPREWSYPGHDGAGASSSAEETMQMVERVLVSLGSCFR
jgi:hypothetical protein